MENTLITLAEIHYDLGLIGHDEYSERLSIALWLSGKYDDNDPRQSPTEKPQNQEFVSLLGESRMLRATDTQQSFLCVGLWLFTRDEANSYPSVPFGYYKNPKQPWPKLDPYTGRVYVSKYQESAKHRLSKADLKKLWQDEKIKSFCREMTIWYQEQFRSLSFPVRNHMRAHKYRM
ncbi:hypothetical protein [Wohlfahrtiimonas sp. G9077]|uniref:hypothetical protein n=1 Tax=Wohlfahrtiimonas sp. G9077 TaxID=1980118 RepID=UPI000B97F2F0|nr:hypothetical protein [Wohlfahrtiimonas sp. G9077]OYQ74449.1 hypothetical protein B9T20_04065 [Wohlfahrtiimonas sp. G9077]